MSIWEDVRFDECIADGHVVRIVVAASGVADAAAFLLRDAPIVTDDWTGPHRRTFDEQLVALLATMGAAVGELESAARAVRLRSDEAAAEQARRLRARELALRPAPPGRGN